MAARRALGDPWARLVTGAAAFLFVAMAAVGLWSGDRETIVIAVLLLVASLLRFWRTGLVGTIAVALLAADVAFWLVPALVSNLTHGDGLDSVLVPAVLAVAALVLLIAAAVSIARRHEPPTETRGPVVVLGAGVITVVVAAGFALLGDAEGPQPGDVEVDLEDTAFVPDDLAVAAGPTAFYVANGDLFWHTFTIEGTDVDVRLASRGSRRVEVDLVPGRYEITCRIPGHEQVGMTGTLEVR